MATLKSRYWPAIVLTTGALALAGCSSSTHRHSGLIVGSRSDPAASGGRASGLCCGRRRR